MAIKNSGFASRRLFLQMSASAVALAVETPFGMGLNTTAANAATPPQPRGGPVMSFYMDRPYLDMSGMDTPYHPPLGARGGEALAHLDDDALARLMPFMA